MASTHVRGRWLAAGIAAAALAGLGSAPALAAGASGPGSAAASFGSGGLATLSTSDARLFGTSVASNGEIAVVGETGAETTGGAHLLVALLTSSGRLDPSFGHGGVVVGPAISGTPDPNSVGRAVAFQPDGKIVVVGSATDADGQISQAMLAERFDANGALDKTFGTGGVVTLLASDFGSGQAVALTSKGQIVIGGAAEVAGTGGTLPRVAIAELDSKGSPVTAFGTSGIVQLTTLPPYSVADALLLQSGGAIVFAGSASPGLQVEETLIGRVSAAGALDTSFAGGGAIATQLAQAGGLSSTFNAIAPSPGGKFVAAGAANGALGTADAVVERFNANGAPDSSFGTGGIAYGPSASNWFDGTGLLPGATGLAVSASGEVLAGGQYVSSVTPSAALWAFTSSGAPVSGFGTSGVVLTSTGSGNAGEWNALAASGGGVITVGDSSPATGGNYSAIAGAFYGFGGAPLSTPKLAGKLSGVARSYKAATVAKQGLKVSASCNQSCTATISLTISGATAKHLHQKTTLVKGSVTLTGSRKGSVTLRLSKQVAKALEGQASVSATLSAAFVSATPHQTAKASAKTTIKG